MKTIEVQGSPFEMGRLQGETTSENWINLIEDLKISRVSESLQKDIEENCPRQMQRLLGIAAGAAVSADSLLLAVFSEVLLSQVDHYIGGCSAAAVRGKASVDGLTVIIKNYDGVRLMETSYIARISRPSDAFHSIDSTAGLFAGCRDGINEKGLAISYNRAYPLDKPDKLVPISILMQEVLERFETTEQAVEFFKDAPRAGGGLIMIADNQGDVASLELSNNRSAVRRPDGERITHTNHYHVPEMVAIDIPQEAFFSDKMPPQLRGTKIRESSEIRYARLARLLGETIKHDEESLKKILADHGDLDSPSDNTICRHGSYFITNCSVMMFPQKNAMKISSGTACEAEFLELKL